MQLTGRWLAASALAALALGLAFVKLFQHHSALMTKATVATQVAVRMQGGCVGGLVGQPGSWLVHCSLPPCTRRVC